MPDKFQVGDVVKVTAIDKGDFVGDNSSYIDFYDENFGKIGTVTHIINDYQHPIRVKFATRTEEFNENELELALINGLKVISIKATRMEGEK